MVFAVCLLFCVATAHPDNAKCSKSYVVGGTLDMKIAGKPTVEQYTGKPPATVSGGSTTFLSGKDVTIEFNPPSQYSFLQSDSGVLSVNGCSKICDTLYACESASTKTVKWTPGASTTAKITFIWGYSAVETYGQTIELTKGTTNDNPATDDGIIGCCESFGYGAQMVECCFDYKDGVKKNECMAQGIGGGTRHHASKQCSTVQQQNEKASESPSLFPLTTLFFFCLISYFV